MASLFVGVMPFDMSTQTIDLVHHLRRVFRFTWVAMWVAATAGQAQANPALPVDLFFQHATFSGAVLSPSGKAVAFKVGAKGGRDRLAVLDLETKKVQPVASFDDADVSHFRWVNDNRLVFDLEDKALALGDKRFAWGLYAVNIDGTGYRQLVARERVWISNGQVDRQLPPHTFLLPSPGPQNSDSILVVQPQTWAKDGNPFNKLMRLNTVTGLVEDVDAPVQAIEWLLDKQGEVRAVHTAKDDRASLQWRDAGTGQWRTLREFKRYVPEGPIRLVQATADGKFYAVSRQRRDTEAVFVYDPASDTLSDKPLVASAQYDIDPGFVIRDDALLGVRFVVDALVTQWFDEGMRAHQAEVDKLLADTSNVLTPPSKGNSPWMLVRAFSDTQPGVYYAYDSRAKKLTRLGSQRPDISPAQTQALSLTDMVRFKARDGLEIPSYLTLPKASADKKKLPLIVYVHGGPWVRGATWGWYPDVQFLASRGYAVLQPEFRGSTGFGLKHLRAGFKQWGLSMQDDLADAARWAIDQGIADPQRICIMGASYGGYATMLALAKDATVFKCGVEWVGVSDLQLYFDADWSDFSSSWKQFGASVLVGDREKDAAQLAATSPIKLAAQIKNPLLMGHGRLDRRVPIEHGKRMYDALKGHNPQVQWVQYDKDGHGWSLPETQVDWWTRVEKFLAQHIPPVK
jgi:acetyl esterase/lipase